ncbi:MAG: hypothetical protein HY901_10510 [Deltaproteobacteria bacterium]|nr:hypothetical protein [Deltaproteobacteria bacterium]
MDRLELLLLIREPQPAVTWSFKVERTDGLALAQVDFEGGLVFASRQGVSRLRIPRPFALDRNGRRKDAPVALVEDVLTVQLDASDLEFPVLLDPSIESAAWEPKVPSLSARYNPAVTRDSRRNRLVLFGGATQSSANSALADTWEYDGVRWRQVTPLHSPPARSGAGLAYDEQRGVAVLFGGTDASSHELSDTWEWDGSDWTQGTPPTSPPARSYPSMAFDSARGRLVLCGGANLRRGDTWEWDGSTWVERLEPGPVFFQASGMAYHPTSARTVLLGHKENSSIVETWGWDGIAWIRYVTPTAPAYGSLLTLDETTGQLFATSGDGANVWTWDGFAWAAHIATSALNTIGIGYLFYDGVRRRVVTISVGAWNAPAADLWEWTGTGWLARWHGPEPRQDFAVAYSPALQRTLLFGGACSDYPPFWPTDLWAWDGETWSELSASAPPPARMRHSMAFDPVRSRLVLFGGYSSASWALLDDTWEWDGIAWHRVIPVVSPPARTRAAMTFDPLRQRLILFGGSDSSHLLNDLWTWDGATWSEVPSSPIWPPARASAALTFDEARGVLVLFGGSARENLGDTWEWDGVQWLQKTPANSPGTGPAVMSYDRFRGRSLLLQGGRVSEWDGVNWIGVPGGPFDKASSGIAFDEARRRLVVVLGDCSQYQETWEYHARGMPCSSADECDTGYCVDGACCETECGGGVADCQACSLAARGPMDGACGPVRCPAPGPCRAWGSCDPATAACVEGPPLADGTVCPHMEPCISSGVCRMGRCEAGAPVPDGDACFDAENCTWSDYCLAGICVGGPKAPDGSWCFPVCHTASECDDGRCEGSGTPLPDGTACFGTDRCTVYSCASGECVSAPMADGTPCTGSDPCAEYACAAGNCVAVSPAADGTACDDHDVCTPTSACLSGICRGAVAAPCLPLDQCHEAGGCDPVTGGCSNPVLPDGTACDDGDACTSSDSCQAGRCIGTLAICLPSDPCHAPGVCDRGTGVCTTPEIPCDAGVPSTDGGEPDAAMPDIGDEDATVGDGSAGPVSADASAIAGFDASDEEDANVEPVSDASSSAPEGRDATAEPDSATAAPASGCACATHGGRFSAEALLSALLGFLMLARRPQLRAGSVRQPPCSSGRSSCGRAAR